MSTLVEKCPAFSIFALAMIIGGGMISPIVAGVVPSDSIFLLIAAFSASLAGIILTATVSGKKGIRELFGRLLIWRVGIGWWAFALFAVVLMYLGGLVLAAQFGDTSLNLSYVPPLYMFIPGFIIKFFLDAGLGEELGWRGFLLPRLQARHNALVSSIIVGIVWGLWHLPLFLLEGMSPTYEFGQAYGVVPALVAYTLFITVPWAILFTWFYNNTRGSLLLAFVFHSSQAWFDLFMDPNNLLGPCLGYTAIMTVTAIVVVLTFGAQDLSRKNDRIGLQVA